MSTDVEAIKEELAKINGFVREQIDPVTRDVGLLKEETERIGAQVVQIQERERETRRRALAKDVGALDAPAGGRVGQERSQTLWHRQRKYQINFNWKIKKPLFFIY